MITDHHHAPCDTCGRPTRYKQWPIRCQCLTTAAGRSTSPLVAEIQAEQEQRNADLRARASQASSPPLRIVNRYKRPSHRGSA